MTQHLPKSIDPIHSAKQGITLSGFVTLNELPRLNAIHPQKKEPAHVELQFKVDAGGLKIVEGTIKTTVELPCERCNQITICPLELKFILSPVLSEYHLSKLPESYEPLMMEGEFVELAIVVEDEILLGLPMVPKHDVCPVELPEYFK